MPHDVVALFMRAIYIMLASLLFTGMCAVVKAAESTSGPPQPELLTNLFQLRTCAEQRPAVIHPFRITADVGEEDSASGILVLRDSSGIEFIQLDLQGQRIEAGTRVCLEGKECALRPKSFGLAIVPRMVVDNDGVHGVKLESGSVFLTAGLTPIRLQWFNRFGDSVLSVEYEGPNLPRQRIPASVLSRTKFDAGTGRTNFSAGLDFRCCEGVLDLLADFARLRTTAAGVATNFDVALRTRKDNVALDFTGFIRIPRDGIYTFHLLSDDGSKLFIGESSVNVTVLSKPYLATEVEKLPSNLNERAAHPLVTLEGEVTYSGFWKVGGELRVRSGADELRVEVFDGGDSMPSIPPKGKVQISGIYQDSVTEGGSHVPGLLLVPSWKSVRPVPNFEANETKAVSSGVATNPPPPNEVSTSTKPPTITMAAEIKALSPDRARQRLPVSIRGVVTAFRSTYLGAVIQDSTRGVFVEVNNLPGAQPLRRGEFCQIDGVTGPGLFAPDLVAQRVTHLGTGMLPEPLRATCVELLNGSLDTEYAEIEGVVTAVRDGQVLLLTEGGKVALDLSEFSEEILHQYRNAFVRIRGCIFAHFNLGSRKLEAGSIVISGATVQVLQPALQNPFDAPQRSIGELMCYDPKRSPFRMLKVAGQVIYAQTNEYFLTDGTNGIRVTTRNNDFFEIGELVEAVGIAGFGGPNAELKEAVVRKTGRASLPAPSTLSPDQLLQASSAGTLVQVEATLLNQWRDTTDYVLELQSGFVAFRARLDSHHHSLSLPPYGSQLELTGVYVPHGAFAGDDAVSSFELLLHSPAGIRVLATPTWWTLKRVLALAGVLAALLCLVLLWNKELHRQVQERGRQLEVEIRNRQQAELQHAAEAERSRIARDLHDELGTGLTEVSLLASAGSGASPGTENNNDRFRVIDEKARALVSGLDVIVWAIDPKHNTLQSFADYVTSYTKQFLSASDIVCRFSIPIECAAVTLSGTLRHNLLLAIKEALNNVVRHASATEVVLQISPSEKYLEIVISDNGRGFDLNSIRRGNGITNFRERLEKLRGQCSIESQPSNGTTVKFSVPLSQDTSWIPHKEHRTSG